MTDMKPTMNDRPTMMQDALKLQAMLMRSIGDDNADLRAENDRLRTVIRVNMLRLLPSLTHEQIDRIIAGDGA